MGDVIYPTVVLTREQRDGCCDLALENLFDGGHFDQPDRLRVVIACGRLFNALSYAEEHPRAEAFELDLTKEIVWLFREALAPFAGVERRTVEEYELLQAWASDIEFDEQFGDRTWDRDAYERHVSECTAVTTAINAVLTAGVAS